MNAPIRYARSGDVNIAYQVTGDGPFDLVLVKGFFSHLEIDWESAAYAHFLERLGSFARLICFDKRGTGLSDRGVGLPDFETRMDDVRAVMDAAGSESAALVGYSEGGPLGVLFATSYPERTQALVLYGTYAKRCDPDDDYPWAPTREQRAEVAAELERTWGENMDLTVMAPNADAALRAWFERRGRAGLSPAGARDLILMNSKADVRELLPSVSCPTLVLHRTGDRDVHVEEGRYLARHIPGARLVVLPGDDHFVAVDADQILDEVEEFLTGTRPARVSHRVLTTILSTDLVGSTERVQGARRRALDGAPRRAPRRGTPGARPLLGRGARHGGGRLPRGLRRAGSCDPVRPRDPAVARPAGPARPSRGAHGRGRASSGREAARDRGPRRLAYRVARRRRRGARQLDDTRSRRGIGHRVRGSR
jgi:pimeloyl-ACP methyl ester carboxylesterase